MGIAPTLYLPYPRLLSLMRLTGRPPAYLITTSCSTANLMQRLTSEFFGYMLGMRNDHSASRNIARDDMCGLCGQSRFYANPEGFLKCAFDRG